MESLENFLTYLKIRLALLKIYSNLKNLRVVEGIKMGRARAERKSLGGVYKNPQQ